MTKALTAGVLPNASNTQKGIAATALQTEVIAGTSQTKVITPFGLATMIGRQDLGYYVPPSWGQFWKPKRNGAGSALATVAAVGSSSTQGLYSSNLLTAPFVSQIMTQLQTQYGNGGSGYFNTARSVLFFGAGTVVNAWNAISGNFAQYSGSWGIGTQDGPGANFLYSSTNGNTITFNAIRGTTIRVYTKSGAGRVNWTYSVDGGAAVSVNDSGTAGSTVQVTTITGLSTSNHSITLTHNGTTGNYFSVYGVTGENATGIVVNNYGLSGAGSSTFTDFTNNYGAGRWSGGPDYKADLVIYALGANDANGGLAGDSWAMNLEQYLQGVKNGSSVGGTGATGNTDVLIVMQHIGNYDTYYKWQDYCSRARGIAEAYGAALVNVWPQGRNSWNYWNNLNYWGNASTAGGVSGTDSIHMSDAGHTAVANAIMPILTAA
jgi:lysophospholipase L1-like esterase